MSFILGFSFIIFLAVFTVLLLLISKRLPAEVALSSVALLILGDLILVGLWYFGLVEIVEVEKHFKLGIAAAFCTASMGRSIYFILKSNSL
jgi:hypothetical protein